MGTGHCRKTFTADIGIAEVSMRIDVFQQHFVAFETVKRTFRKCLVYTSANTFLAAAVIFVQTEFTVRAFIRFQLR